MAVSGLAATVKTSMEGRQACPFKGGARWRVRGGMSREAPQEGGGQRSTEIMGKVNKDFRADEVALEMRAVP